MDWIINLINCRTILAADLKSDKFDQLLRPAITGNPL
jgi:hypothetical protein